MDDGFVRSSVAEIGSQLRLRDPERAQLGHNCRQSRILCMLHHITAPLLKGIEALLDQILLSFALSDFGIELLIVQHRSSIWLMGLHRAIFETSLIAYDVAIFPIGRPWRNGQIKSDLPI
ncbi:hypothetical protein AQ875_21470 [Burkholderia pseudomallei]|nr:hypothetical protein AQ875_21470 [Burkholderia pseudomallei]